MQQFSLVEVEISSYSLCVILLFILFLFLFLIWNKRFWTTSPMSYGSEPWMIAKSAKPVNSSSMETDRMCAMARFPAMLSARIRWKYPADGQSKYQKNTPLHAWKRNSNPKYVQPNCHRIWSNRKFDLSKKSFSIRNNLICFEFYPPFKHRYSAVWLRFCCRSKSGKVQTWNRMGHTKDEGKSRTFCWGTYGSCYFGCWRYRRNGTILGKC